MNHIGIDFDDTLVDMRKSIVKLLNKIHNKNLDYEEMVEYGVSDLYGYSFEAFVDFLQTIKRNCIQLNHIHF
ncbi:hypothetical protein AAHH67_18900 [Niallia circulans]